MISEQFRPDGFNVGFNENTAAGQTVFHFHLHIIPRYAGDVADPRGGVRHVIPDKANYLAVDENRSEIAIRQKLVKGGTDPLLPHLLLHLDGSTTCDIAVAFLLDSGARMIVAHLRDLLARGGTARILVGDYLNVTEPAALRRLNDLSGDFTVRVFESRDRGFHLKTYIFQTDAEGIAFVGSSNISAPALTGSIEWNYKMVSRDERAGFWKSQPDSKVSSIHTRLSLPTKLGYAATKRAVRLQIGAGPELLKKRPLPWRSRTLSSKTRLRHSKPPAERAFPQGSLF